MLSTNVEQPSLVPVVELEPSNFGQAVQPDGSPWSDEQVRRYWHDCVSQAGLGHLVPVAPRSWLVTLDQLLHPPVLRKVIEVHLREPDHDVENVDVPPFSGGFALFDGAVPLLLPQCCGDLGDLAEWHRAGAYRDPSEGMMWVGHPWFEMTYTSHRLHIRETSESRQPSEVLRSVSVDPYALARAVGAARARLLDVVPRVAACLVELGFEAGRDAAESMVGVDVAR